MSTMTVGAGPIWTPRPRYRKDGTKALINVWHDWLMQTYSDAAWDWHQRREDETNGVLGSDEEADFRLENPCPQLKDFMIRLGREWRYQREEENYA